MYSAARSTHRRRRLTPSRLTALAVAALLLASCKSSFEIRTNIDRIEVVADKGTIETGEVAEITATAFDEDGEELEVGFSWNSNLGNIRLLDRSTVQFQSIDVGTATISASIGLQVGTTTIEVVEAN